MNISKTNLVRQVNTNEVIHFSIYNLPTLDNTFGKILYKARKSVGYTQDQLAKAAGISKPYVGTIENMRPHTETGATPKPDREKIISLVNALNEKLPAEEKLNLDNLLVMVGHAPTNSEIEIVPRPILDAIARSGTLSEKDSIFIAGIIDQIEKRNREEN